MSPFLDCMQEKIITTLKNIGLENKEIQNYLTLLKLGTATVSKLSEETRIDRTSSYTILERLMDRGLVSYVIKNNVKYFQAADPRKLLSDLEEKKKEIETILPDLLGLTKFIKEETKVELYKGKEGLITVLRDIIRERKNYFAFGEEGQYQEILPVYVTQFLRDLQKYNIKEKVLSKESKREKILLTTKNSEIRYLPEKYFSPVMTVVYGDKTAIFIWTEPYHAILIKNMGMAESYRNYFSLLWKIAKI